jgi:hypothetical protein
VRTCNVLVGNQKQKLLGRPRQKPEDNIKFDFREITEVGTHYIVMAQDVESDGLL